jgi:hypothetical protein
MTTILVTVAVGVNGSSKIAPFGAAGSEAAEPNAARRSVD